MNQRAALQPNLESDIPRMAETCDIIALLTVRGRVTPLLPLGTGGNLCMHTHPAIVFGPLGSVLAALIVPVVSFSVVCVALGVCFWPLGLCALLSHAFSGGGG